MHAFQFAVAFCVDLLEWLGSSSQSREIGSLSKANAAAEWRVSFRAWNGSVASCVLSIVLTEEHFLHFQLNRNKGLRAPLKPGPHRHTETAISGDTPADWSEAFALVPSLSVAETG